MEEQTFAMMLRQVLTEYDFERIDIEHDKASVVLRREVLADNGKEDTLTFAFSNPTLVKVLKDLLSYLPSL